MVNFPCGWLYWIAAGQLIGCPSEAFLTLLAALFVIKEMKSCSTFISLVCSVASLVLHSPASEAWIHGRWHSLLMLAVFRIVEPIPQTDGQANWKSPQFYGYPCGLVVWFRSGCLFLKSVACMYWFLVRCGVVLCCLRFALIYFYKKNEIIKCTIY